MALSKLLAVVALCAIAFLFIGVAVDTAFAQDSAGARSVDKEISQRRGVSDSLAPIKKDDGKKGPNATQMFIGFGSIVVMIIVVKWL